MFKVETSGFDKPLFPELTTFIRTLPDVLHEEALDLAVSLEEELVNIYSEAPPRGSNKFIWSLDPEKNEAGRRGFWARVKRGEIQTDGKHSIRKGKPPYGAEVHVQQIENGVQITITNKWEKASIVFGSLNKANQNRRVPGHIQTRWEAAFPKYERARKRLMKDLDSRILARLRSTR